MKMTSKLRELLKKGMVVAPGCFDALSARLAELAGFSAIHLTGLGVEAAQLAAPDIGILSQAELVAHAARITAAIDIPVIADIDTGFGGVLNVQRTIQQMERCGVAAVHMEDQTTPKHCPLLKGREVLGRAQAIDRLKAALDARTDPDFLIVARTDADVISLDEVIARCNLYLEAGADLVMPMTMTINGMSYFSLTPDEQMDLSRRLLGSIKGPVMNMGTPPPAGYTCKDLEKAGYALTVFACTALSAAANAIATAFQEIKRHGTDSGYVLNNPGPYHDIFQLMRAAHLDRYVAFEERHTAAT